MLRDTTLINAGLQTGMLDAQAVADYKLVARREHKDLLGLLSYRLRFPIADLYRAYADINHLPFLHADQVKVNPELLIKLSPNFIERRSILPLMPIGGVVHLLVANPEDKAGIEQAKRLLPQSIQVCLCDPTLIQQLLLRITQNHQQDDDSEETAEFDPVASLQVLITQAYLYRASDIHFEPNKEKFLFRFRVDGRLQDYPCQFTLSQGAALMSRMKVLTGMDISEQRMAQDGGMTFELDNTISFDIRAATIPTRFGERATLRLLGSDSQALSLAKIGMSDKALARFAEAIRKPHGMILITGPTGSGKSTTLYSALQQIASKDINVLTVEDPVEYVMQGISQVQVNTKVSFADALRSFLRHDPDVIMVGEIRDGETAGIAMKAALTGHLVFSTLHTNSAISTISRLADIGAEPYLIGSTLVSVIAQRLIRRLCPHCKQVQRLDEQQKRLLKLKADTSQEVYQAIGCAYCHDTGYRGRIALFETLWVDDDLAQLIAKGKSETVIRANAKDFVTLADDCREKIFQGYTSLDEFNRLALAKDEALSEATNETLNEAKNSNINSEIPEPRLSESKL